MLSPLICGANFQDDEDLPCTAASNSSSSPRRSCGSRRHSKNNPYSNRGLDKFSALLSDLTEKRRQIYSTMSSQDPPLVRFVFPGSTDDCVPLVIKLRDPKLTKHSDSAASATAATEAVTDLIRMPATEEINKESADLGGHVAGTDCVCEGKRLISILTGQSWRRPAVYVPVALILILLFLAVFGRSVAILCTSIGWYLIPTLSSRRPAPKREYVRKLSGGVRNKEGIIGPANRMAPSASAATSPRSGNGKKKELARKLSEMKERAASPPPPAAAMVKSGSPPSLSRELKHRKSF
ncbi:hypothetical protein LINGRAHAP2_LOCUS23823 [Linum grandiflorum]